MTTDWDKLDKGTEQLILVGPLRNSALTPALEKIGLAGVPQIAIDGGSRAAMNPVLWAGDGDSGPAPRSTPAFIKPTQDITDFRFCLDGIRNWRWKELHLFGFLGGRRDHELACFGEIHTEMKARPAFTKAVFYGSDDLPQVTFFQSGEHTVKLEGTFSVLMLEPAVVTISGDCRYPTKATVLGPLSGQGISNEASGTIKISATGPFMLLCGL
jgi:thiamine pyrophosphokinase